MGSGEVRKEEKTREGSVFYKEGKKARRKGTGRAPLAIYGNPTRSLWRRRWMLQGYGRCQLLFECGAQWCCGRDFVLKKNLFFTHFLAQRHLQSAFMSR